MKHIYIRNVQILVNITIKDEVTNHTSMKRETMYIMELRRYPQETKVMSLP